jgi:hypothetical protein
MYWINVREYRKAKSQIRVQFPYAWEKRKFTINRVLHSFFTNQFITLYVYKRCESSFTKTCAFSSLENTERPIKNGKFRVTGSIEYTIRRKTKQKYNTICVGHHCTKTITYNVKWNIFNFRYFLLQFKIIY